MASEIIMEIGAEGGSIKVLKNEEGKFYFTTSEFDLDDNFYSSSSNYQNRFKDLLVILRNKYPIYGLHPVFVHQDYIDDILQDLQVLNNFKHFDYHNWAKVLQVPKTSFENETDWHYAVNEMEKSLRQNFIYSEPKTSIPKAEKAIKIKEENIEVSEFNKEGFKEKELIQHLKTITNEELVSIWKVSKKDNAHKPIFINWLETEIRNRNIIEQFELQQWIK